MKRSIRSSKNFLGILGSSIIQSGFNFIFFTAISLMLTSNLFGEFSFFYTLMYFIVPFLDFGSSTYIMSSKKKKYVNTINNYLNTIIYFLLIIATILIILKSFLYAILLLNVIFLLLQQFLQSVLIKEKLISPQLYFSLINGIGKSIGLILIFYFRDSNFILDLIFIVFLVINIVSVIPFLKLIRYRFKTLKFKKDRYIFKEIFWIGITSILTILIMRFDQIIIGLFISKEMLGYYLIAMQWLTIVSLISNALLKYSFTESQNKSVSEYLYLLKERALRINILLLLSFTAFLVITSFIIFLLYDNNNYIFFSVLILSIGYLFSIKFNTLSVVFYMERKSRTLFVIQVYQFFIQYLSILALFPLFHFYSFPLAFSIIRVFGYFQIKYFLKKVNKSLFTY